MNRLMFLVGLLSISFCTTRAMETNDSFLDDSSFRKTLCILPIMAALTYGGAHVYNKWQERKNKKNRLSPLRCAVHVLMTSFFTLIGYHLIAIIIHVRCSDLSRKNKRLSIIVNNLEAQNRLWLVLVRNLCALNVSLQQKNQDLIKELNKKDPFCSYDCNSLDEYPEAKELTNVNGLESPGDAYIVSEGPLLSSVSSSSNNLD